MQIVFVGDNLHEMSIKAYFLENDIQNLNTLSDEIFTHDTMC